MMTRKERDTATIVKEESGAAWAIEGNKFEERVLARLKAEQPLLGPGPSEDRLGQDDTIAFLSGHTKEKAATQLGLDQGPSFRAAMGDRKGVGRGKSVLVHVDIGGRRYIKKKNK